MMCRHASAASFLIVLIAGAAPVAPAGDVAPAAAEPAAVGVDEKLGERLPAGIALRDEEGRPVDLRAAIDKPTILTLNYFRCAGICTPLLNGLQETVNAVAAVPGKDFQVITVSFDPTDTPEVALQKKRNYLKLMTRPFPPEAWRFFTGDQPAIDRTCDAVGFRFRKEGEEFIHAGVIFLLSPEGRIARYIYGTSFLPAEIEEAIGGAARGEVMVTRSAAPFAFSNAQWLFCSIDSQGRPVLNVLPVAGLALLVLGGGFGAWLAIKGRGGKKEKTSP